MEMYQGPIQSDNQIRNLLVGIQNLTIQMNNTFQQAVLRHEEQFIKTYRIKIAELTNLFEELTQILEDKFINNALTNRLDIVMKERDYFKYQCLKLNVQYQTALNEQNNLSSQVINITDQMKIYKHLLEDQKLKNKELQKNAEKFKNNFSAMAYKTLTENVQNLKAPRDNDELLQKKTKKINLITAELKEKNQQIRGLKVRLSELEMAASEQQNNYFEKKQLYEVFKICVSSWKREVLTKQRKNHINSPSATKHGKWSTEKLATASKKNLLKYLFTSSQFLNFIENLLFSPKFSVSFSEVQEPEEEFMNQNRTKLFEYMRRKKVIGSMNPL